MKQESKGKQKTGKVVSLAGQKTVIVAVDHFVKHPLYGKTVRSTRRFATHNEIDQIQVGDRVQIAEVKPISKTKRFIVVTKL
jgi:small subunit ribosomal protein S17